MLIAAIVVLSLIIGLLGKNRKFGFWGYFFGSILLTPIMGVLLVLRLMKNRRLRNWRP